MEMSCGGTIDTINVYYGPSLTFRSRSYMKMSRLKKLLRFNKAALVKNKSPKQGSGVSGE